LLLILTYYLYLLLFIYIVIYIVHIVNLFILFISLGRITEVLLQIRKGKALVRLAVVAVSGINETGKPEVTLIERDLSKLALLEITE